MEEGSGGSENEPEETDEDSNEHFKELLRLQNWCLNFGKHSGKTLAEVEECDRGWIWNFALYEDIAWSKPDLDSALSYHVAAVETADSPGYTYKSLISIWTPPNTALSPRRFRLQESQKHYRWITEVDARKYFRLTDLYLGILTEARLEDHNGGGKWLLMEWIRKAYRDIGYIMFRI